MTIYKPSGCYGAIVGFLLSLIVYVGLGMPIYDIYIQGEYSIWWWILLAGVLLTLEHDLFMVCYTEDECEDNLKFGKQSEVYYLEELQWHYHFNQAAKKCGVVSRLAKRPKYFRLKKSF